MGTDRRRLHILEKEDKPLDPVQIALLGAKAVALEADDAPDLVEQFWLAGLGRNWHIHVHIKGVYPSDSSEASRTRRQNGAKQDAITSSTTCQAKTYASLKTMSDNSSKPTTDLPYDNEGNTLKLRLDAARSAQERTRLAFLTVTVIAFAMLAAEWNAHLSLYKTVAQEFSALAHVEPKDDANTGVQELQKAFMREYVADRMVNISLLGIRIGADDAPLLGGIALTIALFWFYQSVRRENFVIGWILRDNSKESPESEDVVRKTRLQIFHGIISYSLFIRVLQLDEPFSEISDFSKDQSKGFLQWVTARIYLLPFVAVIGLLMLEIWALCTPSPFRIINQPLAYTLMEKRPSDWFLPDFWWRLLRLIIAAVLASTVIWRLCDKIQKFEENTEKMLRKFYGLIRTSHSHSASER